MEDSKSQPEPNPTTGETQFDTVDHDRLARLVKAQAPSALSEEAPPQQSATWENMPAAATPQPPARFQASAQPSAATAPYAAPPPPPVAAAPKRSSSSCLIVIALIGLALLAGLFGIYFLKSAKSVPDSNTTNSTNQGRDPNRIGPPMKTDLVELAGGTFQMGRADGANQEGPPHTVTVKAFAIDRTEVTNAEYAQFVEEGYPAPSHFKNGKPPSGQEQWPVTNVSLEDAKAFAVWRSKRDGVTYRLPTEEEWEFAARDGSQGTIFPWGSAWADGKANVSTASLKPVGSSANDKTRAGVVDMIGNAYEWTSSKASYYQGNSGQVKDDNKEWAIIRGGAYTTDITRKQISATYRDWIPPKTTNSALGFRLVRAQ